MTDKKLKVGLVGCGHLGKIHCKLLNNIGEENPNITFAEFSIPIKRKRRRFQGCTR
jgi:hypothetical protein